MVIRQSITRTKLQLKSKGKLAISINCSVAASKARQYISGCIYEELSVFFTDPPSLVSIMFTLKAYLVILIGGAIGQRIVDGKQIKPLISA